MTEQHEQKISVRSDMLSNLISALAKGEYRIPQFQREFVWSPRKIVELFDSIFHEYPIGSFFIWQAGKEYHNLFRHVAALDAKPVHSDDKVSYILDGQQRSTSLYVALRGMTVEGVDYASTASAKSSGSYLVSGWPV